MRCKSSDFWKDHVKNILRNLDVQFVSIITSSSEHFLIFHRLIATVDHSAAMRIIASHRATLDQLSAASTSSGAAHGGVKHLNYLITHWMPIDMWKSWSDFGRLAASSVLQTVKTSENGRT